MEYHSHLLETHGNNNLLSRFGNFDISKYPMYSANGDKNFIDDIYDNIDSLEEVNVDTIDKPILPEQYIDNRFYEEEKEEIDNKQEHKDINEEVKKEIEVKDDDKKEKKDKIEEFTVLKNLFNKQLKEREQEQMLFFVAIIGICIILLINNKRH